MLASADAWGLSAPSLVGGAVPVTARRRPRGLRGSMSLRAGWSGRARMGPVRIPDRRVIAQARQTCEVCLDNREARRDGACWPAMGLCATSA